MLRMPTISKNEIQGLAKTFSLYTKFPKERWPEIKIAESDSVEGAKMMTKFGKEFDDLESFLEHHFSLFSISKYYIYFFPYVEATKLIASVPLKLLLYGVYQSLFKKRCWELSVWVGRGLCGKGHHCIH